MSASGKNADEAGLKKKSKKASRTPGDGEEGATKDDEMFTKKSKSDDEWERVKRVIGKTEEERALAQKEAAVVDDAVAYYAQRKEPTSPGRNRLSVSTPGTRTGGSTIVGRNRLNTNARRVSTEFNIKVQQFNIEKEGVFKSYKYQQLPPLRVKPLSSQSNVVELFGPSDEAGAAEQPELLPGGEVYCRAISTYPWDVQASTQAHKAAAAAAAASGQAGSPPNSSSVPPKLLKVRRVGDPICDVFGVQVFANRTLVALADGCNWGEKPKKAAQMACKTFLEHMKSKFNQVNDIKTAGHYMLRALAHAHKEIMNTSARDAQASGKTMRVTDGGTTTLLGGILLELEAEEAEQLGSQWVFVCVNVGDCKAYLYSPSSRQVIDVTRSGNRSAKADMSDPGGRLGPTVGRGGDADLRNLGLYMAPCEEDSLLLVVSDGIHDNLDPEHLGLTPSDVGVSQDKWDSNWEALEKAKHLFRASCLMQKIRGPDEEVRPSPEDAVNRLLDHCKQVTKRSRQWMVTNPTKRLPHDHINFPGKMDHTSCIAMTVGRRQPVVQEPIVVATGSSISAPLQDAALAERRKYRMTGIMIKTSGSGISNGAAGGGGDNGGSGCGDTNVPIAVTVAQNEDQVAVVCRALSTKGLSCAVQGKRVELKMRNSSSSSSSSSSATLVPEGFRVVGNNEVDAKKWKRVVELPCAVMPSSQQSEQLDDHTVLFTFTKAPV